MLKMLIVFFACGAPTAALADVDQADNIRIATDRIMDVMIQEDIPAVSVAVALDGEMVWAEGFGVADRASGRAADKDTAHAVASITKPFTAVAIMMLADEGGLDLDAPVNRYLGERKLVAMIGDADQATIRQLLNHTSGLPYHHAFFFEDEAQGRLGEDESIRRFGKLVNAPGEFFEYSNFGYGVLEYVIERVSGKSYPAFLEEEIFEPLALDDAFLPASAPENRNAATRYRHNGSAVPFYDFHHRGAAAVFASAEDLASFGLAYMAALDADTDFLSRAAAQAMIADPVELSTFAWDFGLGWQVRTVNERMLLTHAGGMVGTRSRLLLAPDEKIAIAVAINTDSNAFEEILNMMTQVFAPQLQDQESAKALGEAMAGNWAGAAALDDGQSLPITLAVSEAGAVRATLGGKTVRIAEIISGREGTFRLVFHDGAVPTPLARRYPHRIAMKVRRRGERLTGNLNTEARPEADRMGSGLSYWVSLNRVGAGGE